MRSSQRQALIVERVKAEGSIKIRQIVEELGVAPATVRRDIMQLADQGLVERIHGGAAKLAFSPESTAVRTPSSTELHFANLAIDLIEEDTVIGIGGGAKCVALMTKLCQSNLARSLTVVTYSLDVVRAARDWGAQQRGMTVMFAGGIVYQNAATGEYASRFLRNMRTDISFLQPEGIDPEAGFMMNDPQVAPVVQTYVRQSRRLVGLVPQDLWQTPGFVTVCQLAKVDSIITTGEVPSFMIPVLHAAKVTVRAT
ncbi:MAG: DeoR/GlpR family DNA-binding transcription regulator [Actinomycetaceae bacterium]|nr:DeoR/GlpR family DNA-binding transcription regulator [Actinomycetaceae bacterium]